MTIAGSVYDKRTEAVDAWKQWADLQMRTPPAASSRLKHMGHTVYRQLDGAWMP